MELEEEVLFVDSKKGEGIGEKMREIMFLLNGSQAIHEILRHAEGFRLPVVSHSLFLSLRRLFPRNDLWSWWWWCCCCGQAEIVLLMDLNGSLFGFCHFLRL